MGAWCRIGRDDAFRPLWTGPIFYLFQNAAQNSLCLLGFQGIGGLGGSSTGGWLPAPQIHISAWPCARYKIDFHCIVQSEY